MPVYFIQAGDDGPIKIGWAESVARRRSQLQVQTYLKLSVRAMIDGDQGVEKRLHDRFKRHLIRGEWFKPEILDEIALHPLSAKSRKAVNEPKKRGPERQFDERLHLVLSAELKADLEMAAATKGETVSEYVRRLIVKALEQAER